MEALRALFELLRVSARLAEWRERLRETARQGVLVASMVSAALLMSAVGLCLLLVAADEALVPYLGQAGSALLLAVLLFAASAIIYARATALLKSPPALPAAPPAKSEEMSNAALLALIGGIVVGTVMQHRQAPKE